jgi:hypothetical protein
MDAVNYFSHSAITPEFLKVIVTGAGEKN